MDTAWDGVTERRRLPDRRQRRNPTLKSLFVHRQRRHLRRATDRRRLVLLDYYHPPLMISVIIVLLLSVGDAMMTLFLMDHGAIELNPVMNFFLAYGAVPFFAAKYLFTALSVMTIVILNYFFIKRLRLFASDLLHYFALGFTLVIVWEFFLTFRYVY